MLREDLVGFIGSMLICSHFYGKSTQTPATGLRQQGEISARRLVLTKGELEKGTDMRAHAIPKKDS